MAAKVIPLPGEEGHVNIDGPSGTLPYLVTEASGFDEALAAVASEAPETVSIAGFTLPLRGFRFKYLGRRNWEFSAQYDKRQTEEERQQSDKGNEPSFTFDTQGGTGHITEALEEVGVFDVNGPVQLGPKFQGAIGVTSEGVEGTDIELAGFNFNYTRYIPLAAWTPDYRKKLRRLSQKVNKEAWKAPSGDEFEKGECRFRFAQGSQKGQDSAEVTYHFHAEEPTQKKTIGNIKQITKEGQMYLWFRYQHTDDNNRHVQRATHAVVNRVYEYGDFKDLEP